MRSFGFFNWLIVGGYMAAMAGLAMYFARRQKNVEDFCLAGRKMGWFPLALSILATGVSAISLIGVPTYIFRKNLQLSVPNLIFSIPLLLFVGLIMIPVLYRLKLYTVYEYLERRFHPLVRTGVSILMIVMRLAWIATAVYIPSLVLSTITGIPVWGCVLLIGSIATLYTVAGGLEAVIWTDVIQFYTIVIGLVVMIIVMLSMFGGSFTAIWKEAAAAGSTKMFDFSFDFHREATFWAVLSGLIYTTLGMFGTDQVIVQRCFAAKNTKTAIWSIVGYSLISVPFGLLLVMVGLGLAAYFHANPDSFQYLLTMDLDRSKALDKAMPYFIMNKLPVGLSGLSIAALFAVTMSSVDSGINSMATMLLKDVFEKHFKQFKLNDEHFKLKLLRWITLIFGLIATLFALSIGQIGTIVKIFAVLASFIAAPLYGIFFLGLFTKRTNTFGVICGSVASYLICPLCYFVWDVDWVWLGGINTFVVMFVGYIASIIQRRVTGNHTLAVYTWSYKPVNDEKSRTV